MSLRSTLALTGIATLGMFLVPMTSMAAPISGTLNLTGTTQAGATFINFLCTLVGDTCPTGSGDFTVTAPDTGSFSTLVGDTGYIKDLSTPPVPINTTFLLSNFVTFNPPGSNIALDLTELFSGVDSTAGCLSTPPAPGQTCTPTNPALVSPTNPTGATPVNFQNLSGGGSSATFSLAGIARNTTTGESSRYTGQFSAQFTSPFQTVLANLPVTTSYSSTFSATVVPEPASALLLFLGMLPLAGLVIRRRRLAKQS